MGVINREEIKKYIMTNLGWPVVSVELDDIQIGMAITTALDEYLATGSVERAYYQVKAEGLNPNQFDLPPEVGTVANVAYAMPFDLMSGITGSTDVFSFAMGGGSTFGAMMGAGYGNFVHGASNLAVFFEYIQNRNRVLGLDITYKIIDNKLYVYPYPKTGDTVLIE